METKNYDPRTTNPIYHLVWGIRFFFSGLLMLTRHPPLLGLSLIPIVITVVALLSLALSIAWLVGGWVAGILGEDLRIVAQALIFLFALMLGYFLYLPVARVLLAPFSEALSRRAHAINTAAMSNSSHIGLASRGWGRAMLEGLKLVMFQVVIGITALTISLVFPPFSAPIGITVAIFICALDFCDVPLSVRGLPFGRKMNLIWRYKSLTIGFGIAAYLSLLIPIVNLFSLPAGVIGATLLINGIEKKK
ncbi:MAG: EI24 domain-containing protein [Acidobacteria bacterium]|nr:EI24 domain-containing protein [Acidobacteriota bacterium]